MRLHLGSVTVMFGCVWGCIWPERSWRDTLHNRLGHWRWTYYDWPWHMAGSWMLELGPVTISWSVSR